jgi:hypothetical protein
MNALTVIPDELASAAHAVTGIGSDLSAAQAAAAGPTIGLVPAAADEVSAAITALFSSHAADYQVTAAQAVASSTQFAQHLNSGAFSYATIESALTSLLANTPTWLQPVVGFPFAVAGISLFVGLLLTIGLLDIAYGFAPNLTTTFLEYVDQFLGVLGVL